MSNANDLVINSNTNGIILKKGPTNDDYKFRLSSDSTSFGSGASSIGLNSISIGCSNTISNTNTTILDNDDSEGNLIIETIRESTEINDSSFVLMYNPDTFPTEVMYSNTIISNLNGYNTNLKIQDASLNNLNTVYNGFGSLDSQFHLQKSIVDASLNQHDVSFNILEPSFNILDSSFNILDTSFNLQKSIVDASLNQHDVSLNLLDNSFNILNQQQNILDTSLNLIYGPPSYGSTFTIGNNSNTTGTNSFSIGPNSSTGSYNNSVAIGNGTIVSSDNKFLLGSETQGIVMNEAYVHNMKIGKVNGSAYSDWSGIQHSSLSTSNNYALMQQNTGKTVINASDGKSIGIRVGNVEYMNINQERVYFPTKIRKFVQPIWKITANTSGNQNYGQHGRIGSSDYKGGHALSHYFATVQKWNTSHGSWYPQTGQFVAAEGPGIYIVELWIFCNNAQHFNGRLGMYSSKYTQTQQNMPVNRKSVNESCSQLRWTWKADSSSDWFYIVNHSASNLTVYHASTGHTTLRVTKIA